MRSIAILILFFAVLHYRSAAQPAGVPDNESLAVTHGPYLQNLTPEGVTVVWTTNRSAIPGVYLAGGRHTGKLQRNSTDGIIDGGGTLHQVRIEGLEPGTQYRYRISSVQVLKYQAYRVYYGDTITGREVSFSTPGTAAPSCRFIIINDIHENSGKLASYLKATDKARYDFCIFNGDMVDFLQNPAQLFRGWIDTATAYFASEKPFIYVRGNHETRGYQARSLRDYFDYPAENYFHAFSYGKTRFIILDCGEDKPDNNRYYYGLADYDRYRLGELEWLRKELKSDEFRNSDKQVVIIHMPVIKQEKQGYGMQFLSEKFGPLLSSSGIDIMFSAHTHRNSYYERANRDLTIR